MSSSNDEQHLGPLDIKSAASDVLKDMMEDVQLLEELESIRQVTPVDIMSWSTHVLSIFTAQAVARTATAPIERVRLIMQTQAVSKVPKSSYIQGLYHAAYRIPARQGYQSLWRGNGTNVLRALPGCLILFSNSNDRHKEILCGAGMAERKSSLGKRVTFAGFAGLCMTAVSYPLDVVRTRLTVDMTNGTTTNGGRYTSMSTCLKRIVAEEGWRALYRGVSLSLISSVPYATVALTSYDNLKGRYERAAVKAAETGSGSQGSSDVSTADRLLGKHRKHSIMAGSISFTFASAMVYPIDTLRRRLIVDGSPGHHRRLYAPADGGGGGGGGGGGVEMKSTSATTSSRPFSTQTLGRQSSTGGVESVAESWSTRGPEPVRAALKVWSEEGIIGFYRGLVPSLVRGMPRAAIMFFVYDVLKSTLTPQETHMRRTITRLRRTRDGGSNKEGTSGNVGESGSSVGEQ
jgi:hypothetical protein